MISLVLNIVNYDVRLYARKGGELLGIVGFFLISTSLFAFAMGAGNPQLASLAPAFICILALLSSLLSIPQIFHRDHADGTLDQIRISALALEWCALAKIGANWMGCQLPLVIIAPIGGLMLGVENEQAARLALTLLLATPILSCIGGLGSALTLAATNRSGILAVIVLPLYIPVLIFAASLAGTAPEEGAISSAPGLALIGILLAAIPLSSWASAAIIRIQD